MARKKVALRRIPNDAARRTTFRNRRNGLYKKASELATLCNVKACVIVYGEGEAQPEVWPSVAEVIPILHRYKAMPDIAQCKKTVTQEGLLCQRMDKLRVQIQKARRENDERHTASLVHKAMLGRLPRLEGLTVEEVTNVGWMVQMNLKSLGERIANLQALAALEARAQPAPSLTYEQQVPHQETWLDMVRAPLVHSRFTDGNDASSSTTNNNMANTSASGGFSWKWPADPGASSLSFQPM